MNSYLPKSLAVLFILLSSLSFAQHNALDFDGINDFVTVTNASSLISSNTAMSMSCWVYPTNSAAGYPDFDGFLGFRNDNNADFYLLQLNSTNVEARFRNSSGTNYDVVQTGMVLNAWQHYALTYDGTTLRVYFNGVLGGSTAASGTISNSTVDFVMGKLNFSSPDFYLDGRLDEVGLWSSALSASEVDCIYNSGINPMDPNLKLYYDLNQGVAGGTNTGITTVTDVTGSIDGVLTGAALTGSSSNWMTGVTSQAQVAQTICDGDSFLFGGQNLNTAGIYYTLVPVLGGCDSIIRLNLSVSNSATSIDVQSQCGPYTWIDGNIYTSDEFAATFTIAGGAANGCDSIVTLNLDIIDSSTGADTIIACVEYTWIDGLTYFTSNTAAMHTIVGGSANGCDSIVSLNLTILNPAVSTDMISSCEAYTWIDGNTYSSSINTAFFTILGGAANGCDSLVNLDLTVTTLDNSVTQNGATLTSASIGASYQWLDCNNGNSAIAGETNATFNSSVSGNFAVEVSQNNCVDTSDCFEVTVSVGIVQNSFNTQVLVYPNPTQNKFNIDLGANYQSVSVEVFTIHGKLLSNYFFEEVKLIPTLLEDEDSGIYFIHIKDKKNRTVQVKVMKN